MDKTAAPALLPIFRSHQQAELLALLLGNPDSESSITELATRSGMAYASAHREVERAVVAGLAVSRNVGKTRLIRADTDSPYYAGLADVLVKAFGPPQVLARALRGIAGIDRAVIHGSWAARHAGQPADRPVGDIDVILLGDPDRDDVFNRLGDVESSLGRPVQVSFRPSDWFETGTGAFHDTVLSQPVVEVALTTDV